MLATQGGADDHVNNSKYDQRHRAEYNYILHCQGCHRADGRGHEPAVPSLVSRLGKMISVPEGRGFLVQVPGTAQAPLSDDEVAHLLNWILLRYSSDTLPQPFLPYSSSEVAEYRTRSAKHLVNDRHAISCAIHDPGIERCTSLD